MFLSPVLTNIKSCHTLPRSLTPMGHEHSTQLHIFVLSHQICWFNAIWTILWYVSCLANFRGFTIQFMSRQTSHSPTSSSLPVSPLLLSTSFQVRSMCSDSTRPSFGRETKTNRPQSARTFTRSPVKPLVHRQATLSDRFLGGIAGIASPESLPRLGRGPWSQRTYAFLLGEMIDGDHGEDHPNFVGLSWMYRWKEDDF